MTKRVRVENADNAHGSIIVQVWETGAGGAPDIMIEQTVLHHAADLTEKYLHKTRYLKVLEG